MQRVVHALTPGDHFSPRTGSAIPTVVDGLATAARGDREYTHAVLLERSTMHPRYRSAVAIEYHGVGYTARWERGLDAGLSRLGLPRVRAQRVYHPLVDAIASHGPAIVIAHNAPVLPRLLLGSQHTSVYFAHNELPRTMSQSEASRALDPAVAILAVSADLAERVAARLSPTLRDRIDVVENGVDVEAFHPREETATPRSRRRIMFVGRVVAEKGPDVLLRAVAKLARDDVEVVIVGSQGFDAAAALSTYEQELRAIAATMSASVVFQPFVDRERLPDLLRSADIFAAPARWSEPSGLTIGEAMSSGLPVIASDAGGMPGVLGTAGVLVPPGDHIALSHALGALLDDDVELRRLSAASRLRAQSRSWERSWQQLRTALDSI